MKTMRFSILAAAVASVLLSACQTEQEQSTNSAPSEVVPVKTVLLQKQYSSAPILSSGQFSTDDETWLSFKTGGVVSHVYVEAGDEVRKGQLLATLNLTEINAQVSQASIMYEKAQRDLKRAESLYRDSVATKEQFQNAQTGLDIAKQQLDAARFNLNYSEIRAQADGVVLRKMVNDGEVVGPGMPVLQTNTKGSTDWVLRVALSDKDWVRVSIGDSAVVNIEALGLSAIAARVSEKSETADPYTGAFEVELKLPGNKSKDIANGMFAKATIFSKKQNEVWQVPYDAVLDGNAEGGFVFVTSDMQTAMKVPVRIARLGDTYLEVTGGLENYPALIVSGSAYLTHNSSIKVVN